MQDNERRLYFAVCRNITFGAHVQQEIRAKIASHAVIRQTLMRTFCDFRKRFLELCE